MKNVCLMLILQLPIAKQQDQLRPDLVYYGFANNFVVAMQDKGGGRGGLTSGEIYGRLGVGIDQVQLLSWQA